METIKIFHNDRLKNPMPATKKSAGMDLCADLNNGQVIIAPNERCLIPTGIHLALPDGYEAQVRPRSGLALKKGVTVLNSPGTIDGDYRGNIGVILINLGKESFSVNDGDRIAQLVISKYSSVDKDFKFENVSSEEELGITERGKGGFDHTGI